MNNRKKILFLSNRGLLPIKDGHSRRSFNILKGLGKYNDIYLLFLYEHDEEISDLNLSVLKNCCINIEYVKAPKKSFSLEMVILLIRSVFSKYPYCYWRSYSPIFKKRVQSLISLCKFDIIHCDNIPVLYSIIDIKNIFRSLTDHDVSFLKCQSIENTCNNIFLKFFLKYEVVKLKNLEIDVFKKFDLGIVVSENDKNIFTKLCPSGSFLVAENGVDTDFFKPFDTEEIPGRLVWLGGFEHYSNKQAIEYFLQEIYPIIKLKLPLVSIDIIGGGLTEGLKRYAYKDSSVKFLGYVDNPVKIINNAELFIAPLLSGGGTKLKILEAMALGKAIVTTEIGCEGITGENYKHYIVADNPREFAKSVVLVLTDKLIKNRLKCNSKKLINEKYSYDNICDKINYFYHNS